MNRTPKRNIDPGAHHPPGFTPSSSQVHGDGSAVKEKSPDTTEHPGEESQHGQRTDYAVKDTLDAFGATKVYTNLS